MLKISMFIAIVAIGFNIVMFQVDAAKPQGANRSGKHSLSICEQKWKYKYL